MRPPANRRVDLRLELRLAATLTTELGETYPVTITNLSRSGLQLVIAAEALGLLLPNTDREQKHLPVSVHLQFRTGDGEDASPIHVRCGMVYVRRISPESCRAGLRYIEFFDGTEHALAGYYHRLLPLDREIE